MSNSIKQYHQAKAKHFFREASQTCCIEERAYLLRQAEFHLNALRFLPRNN